jgi:hypothetical protein
MTEPMTLAVFVGDLRRRLETLSAEQLRDILLAYGQGLPGRDRAAFLDLFPTTAMPALQARNATTTRCRPISSLSSATSLAVCRAEALAWSGGDGAALLESVCYAYPRHRAFKDRLRKALAARRR